jgi:23S rRNA (uridine2552-2'-O)-methyltransferase|tara:strand:- start:3899 stop:4510 length:612 start_codon:yes stop_codon:yes gene_type:complete
LKKNRISKNWINKQKRDIFVRQSKIEGYSSRAAYKLIEINKKFKILRNGISLVDLGAAPGSWSQYISRNFKNIKLLSIDLKEMEEIGNIYQIIGDFTANEPQKKIKNYFKSKIDVVLSDMAQNTTGNKNLDVISTTELCKEAMFFAKDILKNNGSFVCKIFMGSTFKEIMTESKLIFKQIKVFKPSSSKKDSRETYLVCKFLR